MSSKIEIPYGPDRKPWSDTLSPLAIKQDGTFLVTPPSSDPEFTYDTSDKERSITPAYYQVPSSGLSAVQASKAQDETYTVTTRQASNFIGYQSNFFGDYSVASKYLNVSVNNIGDPFVPATVPLTPNGWSVTSWIIMLRCGTPSGPMMKKIRKLTGDTLPRWDRVKGTCMGLGMLETTCKGSL